MAAIKFNKKKFENVLLYILNKCGTFPNVGKTVLFKLLYFCDFDFFELYEKPLSGEQYVRISMGPAPSHFDNAIKNLKKEGKIKEVKGKFCGFEQKKFLALQEPDLDVFTAKEIVLIDKTINRLSGMTANQIKSHSHNDMPVKVTEKGELIDYGLVFYRDPDFSVREYSEDDN